MGPGGVIHQHRPAPIDPARGADHRLTAAAENHASVGEPGTARVRRFLRSRTGLIALPLVYLYWFFAGPALLLAVISLRGERKRAEYVERRLAERVEELPPG